MRIAAVILLAPVFALAQASPEPPSPPPSVPSSAATPEAAAPAVMPSTPVPPAPSPASTASVPLPSWSIGAGLASGDYLFPFRSDTYVGFLGMTPLFPVVTASLERRVGDRTWLSVGASGSINRIRQDPWPGYVSLTRADGSQVYVTAGVRHVITAAAPVEVSLLVLGEGGYASWNQRFVGGTIVSEEQSAWLAGASLGLSVDRELVPGLTLRVATPLAGLSWTRTRTDVEGQGVEHGSDFAARVILAPRLELRLAF